MESLISQFQRLKVENKTSGLIYHKDCEKHIPSVKQAKIGHFKHVENPNRVSKSLQYIKKVLVNKLQNKVESNIKLEGKMIEEGEISLASKVNQNGEDKKFRLEYIDQFDEIKQEHVVRAHGQVYYEKTRDKYVQLYEEYEANLRRGKKAKQPGEIVFDHFEDMYYSVDTQRAMNLSAEGTRFAVEKVFKNEWSNAFVLTRPPGHHARKNGVDLEPSGFCFYNNVAIAAKWL